MDPVIIISPHIPTLSVQQTGSPPSYQLSGIFYRRPPFSLSPPLSLLLSCSQSLALFFSPFLSFPPSCRADTQQKRLMVVKIRKQGDVRRLLGKAGTQTAVELDASPQLEALEFICFIMSSSLNGLALNYIFYFCL